jgi:hypothetical protein
MLSRKGAMSQDQQTDPHESTASGAEKNAHDSLCCCVAHGGQWVHWFVSTTAAKRSQQRLNQVVTRSQGSKAAHLMFPELPVPGTLPQDRARLQGIDQIWRPDPQHCSGSNDGSSVAALTAALSAPAAAATVAAFWTPAQAVALETQAQDEY